MPVAIVNEAFVRQYLPTASPIGMYVQPGIGNGYKSEPKREIVGIVRDIRASSLRRDAEPVVYVPAAQCPSIGSSTVLVRTALPPQDVARTVRRIVASLDRSVSVSRLRTLDDYLSSTMVQPRFSSLLVALFAVVSSALAAIGLYGLMSYGVAQRVQEFGVRLALGAAPRAVLALVLGQAARIALAGIALGLPAALIAAELMATLLFGVGPHDLLTIGAVAGLLFVVALGAGAVPALRAMRVDPVVALRRE